MKNNNSAVSIICTGSELTNGFYTNSNGKEIAAALYKENFNIIYHLCVPDDKQAIISVLDFCSRLSELIIITGGLGPTEDDLTRDALAQYLKLQLVCDSESEVHIKNRLGLFGMSYKNSYSKMASFPEGALIHVNQFGSANGCTLENDVNTYCMLPGPPKECLEMFFRDVLPYLTNKFKNSQLIKKSWKIIGLVENDVDLIFKDLSQLTHYSICWRFPYVEVSAAWPEPDDAMLQTHLNLIQKKLYDHCIPEIAGNYSEYLNKILDTSDVLSNIKLVSSSPVINELFQKLTANKNQKKILKIECEIEYKNDQKDGLIKIYFQQKIILNLPFRDDNYEIFLKEWISFKILQYLGKK